MKRVAILVAAIAFTVSINTKVFATGVKSPNSASNETNINEVVNKDTGIMPDSVFYFVDKGLDNLKLFLTFNDAKKTEIILQIANERLTEYDSMTAKEKYGLAKDIIKELEKLSDELDGSVKQTVETQLVKREAIANMVEKRHQLNAARQEYQLVKISLEQAKKSGDEAAIKVAEELLKEKQSLYKAAKEEFEISFDKMKKIINELKKSDENAKVIKVETKVEKVNKVENDKNINETVKVEDDKSVNLTNKEDENKNASVTNKLDEKSINQTNNEKIIKVAKVICKDQKDVKQENKNSVSNIKIQKVVEVTKKTERKKENKKIRHNNLKQNDKKIKGEINKKWSENKNN